MAIRIAGNAAQYRRRLRGEVQTRRRHTLTLANTMEYAEPLHNREGYYVFSDERAWEAVATWLKELVESDQSINATTIAKALDGAGFEEINRLRSYTDQMRPPVREGQGMRRAHPGGWSDITNNLRNGYRHLVNGRRGRRDYAG